MGVFSVVMYHGVPSVKKKSPSRNPTAAGVMLQKNSCLLKSLQSTACLYRENRVVHGCWQQFFFSLLAGFTLQGINISHLGKRKIIFKMPFLGGYVSSLKGNLPPKITINRKFPSFWPKITIFEGGIFPVSPPGFRWSD